MNAKRRMTGIRDKICTGADLARALEKSRLTPEEARAWQKDLVAARKALKRQGNKWKT